MSWLYHGFYVHNPLLLWPILALVLFMSVFVVAAIRTWRSGDLQKFDHLTRLPLDSDGVSHAEGARHGR